MKREDNYPYFHFLTLSIIFQNCVYSVLIIYSLKLNNKIRNLQNAYLKKNQSLESLKIIVDHYQNYSLVH